ncbi:hypothetical protein [Micromonospora sp. KLBMP9576]|uniref:hypothetical protein n=1 Tax=Micromonospora sp. KLBMP9576 TaxID=3424769 RepID=UPI003D8DB1C8
MTPPADAPARPPRPATVTVAFWLQLVTVLVLLGLVALAAIEAIQWDNQIDRAVRAVPDADPDEVRGERWSNVSTTVVFGLVILLLATSLAATALPVRRGGNTARILVFVAGGLQLLACCAPSFLGALALPMIAFGFDDEPYPEGEHPEGAPADASADIWAESKFFETLYATSDPFDAVFFPLAGGGAVAVLVLTLAVVLLLALPPAHRWFVPRTAGTAAPMPPAGFPVFPVAYPSSPGRPGYHAAPGYLICPDPAAHQPPPPAAETGATEQTED